MRVFVTGADGFIGSHLCEALRDAGHDVTGLAFYNSFDSFGWLDEVDGVAKIRGDVRDAEQIRKLINGHEVVFHLAALISVPHSYDAPRAFIDTNVTGTLNVLLAARDAGAKIVHTSTSEVYGTAQYTPQDETHPIKPQSPYAASKVAADALVRSFVLSYGMSAVILRPFNTYGPRQSERAVIGSICRQMADPRCSGYVEVGHTESARDFMYITDTVAAFLAVMPLDGVFNAATGVCTKIEDLLGTVLRVHSVTRQRPDGSEVHRLIGDASALAKATGWQAAVNIEDGFARTLNWWRSRSYRKDIAYVV